MKMVPYILVGLVAQIVDGTVGMGFGLLSSTFLLALGTSAVLASASVHIAEMGTTLSSGLSHWRLGNVDIKLVVMLGLPGSIGAFLGATFLSSLSLEKSKVFISTVLLITGFLLLYRNLFTVPNSRQLSRVYGPKYFRFIGFSGGFVDAAGGGGWGPVVTPTLLVTTQIEPRKVIGTVSATEFLVATSASLGFILQLKNSDLDLSVVVGLAVGGIFAAPFAALLVSRLPRKALGISVAIAIILINGAKLVIT